MTDRVPAALRALVRQRAQECCEYCRLHERDAVLRHEPDHIVAIKHGGPTVLENLAWACFDCNWLKGSDLSSIDSKTANIERLFNPRRDHWAEHFRIEDGLIVPLSAIGRVTIGLLRLNTPRKVETRRSIAERQDG